MRKFESFKWALQACKARQVIQKQQKKDSLLHVSSYWATTINNAKIVYDLLKAQELMSNMEQTAHQVEAMEINVGGSKPPPSSTEVDDSNEG